MHRRNFLRVFGRASLLLLAPTSLLFKHKISFAQAAEGKRFYLIKDGRAKSLASFRTLVNKSLDEHFPGWEKKLVTLDVEVNKAEVMSLIAMYGPNTSRFSWPTMIAVPADGAGAEGIQVWNRDWLTLNEITQVDPACYPRRNKPYWSVEGDWNPTQEKVKTHLFKSPNHTDGHFEETWLGDLNLNELQSIHSDHHDEMQSQVATVHWDHVNKPCPTVEKP